MHVCVFRARSSFPSRVRAPRGGVSRDQLAYRSVQCTSAQQTVFLTRCYPWARCRILFNVELLCVRAGITAMRNGTRARIRRRRVNSACTMILIRTELRIGIKLTLKNYNFKTQHLKTLFTLGLKKKKTSWETVISRCTWSPRHTYMLTSCWPVVDEQITMSCQSQQLEWPVHVY